MATGRRTSRCVIKNAAKPIEIRARAQMEVELAAGLREAGYGTWQA
jgi:hypothetical protein